MAERGSASRCPPLLRIAFQLGGAMGRGMLGQDTRPVSGVAMAWSGSPRSSAKSQAQFVS